jgi:hypothetical protein
VPRAKNKVVIWRPFPSPTKRETAMPSVLSLSGLLRPQKQNSTSANDEAAVNRWVELADILNGKKKDHKKRSAA